MIMGNIFKKMGKVVKKNLRGIGDTMTTFGIPGGGVVAKIGKSISKGKKPSEAVRSAVTEQIESNLAQNVKQDLFSKAKGISPIIFIVAGIVVIGIILIFMFRK